MTNKAIIALVIVVVHLLHGARVDGARDVGEERVIEEEIDELGGEVGGEEIEKLGGYVGGEEHGVEVAGPLKPDIFFGNWINVLRSDFKYNSIRTSYDHWRDLTPVWVTAPNDSTRHYVVSPQMFFEKGISTSCRPRRHDPQDACVCKCWQPSYSSWEYKSLNAELAGQAGSCYCDANGRHKSTPDPLRLGSKDFTGCLPDLLADCCIGSANYAGKEECDRQHAAWQSLEDRAEAISDAKRKEIQARMAGGGDCITGDSLVHVVENGTTVKKRVDAIRQGDQVQVQTTAGKDGVGSVLAVLAYVWTPEVSPNPAGIDVLRLPGGLGITYTHPIVIDGKWTKPKDVVGARAQEVDTVYNFLLDAPYGPMYINGVPTVYAGHGLANEPGLQPWGKPALDKYGNHSRMVAEYSVLPGWENGYITQPYKKKRAHTMVV